MQKHAHGDENQVVVIEVQSRDRPPGILAEEVYQVPTKKTCHEDDQQRAVFKPLSRFLPRFDARIDLFKFKVEIIHCLGALGFRSREVGNGYRNRNEGDYHPEVLPDEKRLSQGKQTADLKEFRRNGPLCGHHEGRRGGKTEGPDGAQPEVGCGPRGPVVHSLNPSRQFADQKAAEDEA